MRRGIREMDLILSAFAERELGAMEDVGLDAYEALLEESDHDIYAWIAGAAPPPARHGALVGRIAAGASGVTRPA